MQKQIRKEIQAEPQEKLLTPMSRGIYLSQSATNIHRILLVHVWLQMLWHTCSWSTNCYLYEGNISSYFSRNSEASASKFRENHDEMFQLWFSLHDTSHIP